MRPPRHEWNLHGDTSKATERAIGDVRQLQRSDAVGDTRRMAAATVRIYLDLPPRHSSRGPRYTSRLGSPAGEVIVTNTLTPLYVSARVLLTRGITGRLEMWDAKRSCARMAGDIAKLAKLRVEESETISPTVRRWKAFPVGT